MISKWYELKKKAIKMRLSGFSIRDVEKKLGIPRSTLSGWFKKVNIEARHKKSLHKRWKKALIGARKKAVKWHNKQKILRLVKAKSEAEDIFNKLDLLNINVMHLALSMLYLGEGLKKNDVTGLGNSDPMILLFFIKSLDRIYDIKPKDIKAWLHLRADQDSEKLKIFWSKKLKIPIGNFGKSSIDKRTIGIKTYNYYNGVCVLRCGNVAIQRKLIYLSKIYCEKIISNLGG